MLQPLQIQDVSVEYAREIADLREFLAKAGLTLDSAETLPGMTARLRDDRAFRRDLTSHAWVAIHGGDRQVRHADLLAMLAIAAAGPRYAADAADAEAHDLLRFVMQVWSSFHAAPVVAAAWQPQVAAQETTPVSFMRGVSPQREADVSLVVPQNADGQRRIVWIGAAACVLVALFLGLLHHHHTTAPSAAAAPVVATGAPPTTSTVSGARRQGEVDERGSAATQSGSRRDMRPTPYSRVAESPDLPAASAPTHAKPAPGIPMPEGRSYAASARAPARPSSRSLHASPAAKPEVVAGSDSNYVPRVVAVDNIRVRGAPVSAGTSRQAIVRPTSLGIMAANVTYSPAPVYPAAASAARVQGEVKLEAEVGRDGTVSSTRIISGPPLLADAAADAVQHWRYRPYLYEGKPIAMNAQIVMDFQLP